MYNFMGKEYNDEKQAVIDWSKQDNNNRKFFTIYKNNRTALKTFIIDDLEKLKEIIKGTNNIEVKFPNSNKIYMYRCFDKIDFNKVESVTFTETRGLQRNLISWVRVYYINNQFIGVC